MGGGIYKKGQGYWTRLMSAIALGPVAYVIAVKRMSILFSALLGFYAFGERGGLRVVGGILAMVVGAVGLSLLSG